MRLLNSTNGRAGLFAALSLVSVSATSVSAQDLVDPTAPPAALRSMLEDSVNGQRTAERDGPDEGNESDDQTGRSEPRPGPVMIVRRAVDGDWRSRALMNGTLVGPGAEVEQGRILAIRGNGVRIENAEGTRTMAVIDGGVSKRRPGTNDTDQE